MTYKKKVKRTEKMLSEKQRDQMKRWNVGKGEGGSKGNLRKRAKIIDISNKINIQILASLEKAAAINKIDKKCYYLP